LPHKKIDYQALQEATKTLRLLPNPNLLPILCRIGEEEVPSGEIAEFVGMSPSALSQHLKRLRELQIVTTRRDHLSFITA